MPKIINFDYDNSSTSAATAAADFAPISVPLGIESADNAYGGSALTPSTITVLAGEKGSGKTSTIVAAAAAAARAIADHDSGTVFVAVANDIALNRINDALEDALRDEPAAAGKITLAHVTTVSELVHQAVEAEALTGTLAAVFVDDLGLLCEAGSPSGLSERTATAMEALIRLSSGRVDEAFREATGLHLVDVLPGVPGRMPLVPVLATVRTNRNGDVWGSKYVLYRATTVVTTEGRLLKARV